MFCKWCGGKIQATEEKCPACGRETPPMSDCGGFYNLKHGERVAATPSPAPAQDKLPCPVIEKMAPKYVKDRQADKKHHLVTLVGCVITLAAIACSVVLLLGVNARLGEIQDQIAHIHLALTQPTEDGADTPTEPKNPTESTEPTAPTEPIEDIQEPSENEMAAYHFAVAVAVDESADMGISSSYDFDGYARKAEATVATVNGENTRTVTVSYMVNENETVLETKLVYAYTDEEELMIGIRCCSGLAFFKDQPFLYQWQYLNDDGEWTDVAQKEFIQDEEGFCGLSWDACFLDGLLQNDSALNLRCCVNVESEEGDTMQLTVEGITFVQEEYAMEME